MGHGLMDWSGIDGFVKDWHWIVGLFVDWSEIVRSIKDFNEIGSEVEDWFRIGRELLDWWWIGRLVLYWHCISGVTHVDVGVCNRPPWIHFIRSPHSWLVPLSGAGLSTDWRGIDISCANGEPIRGTIDWRRICLAAVETLEYWRTDEVPVDWLECRWMGPLVAKSSPVETLQSIPIVHLFEGY